MRLFIAITLQDKVKDRFYDLINHIQEQVKRGSFTLKDNLHLTLVFIGETNRLEEVKLAMRNAVEQWNSESFSITFRGTGSFKRREGDIFWVGVDNNEKLNSLYLELSKELDMQGFFMEAREYKPHLTIGRRIILNTKLDAKAFKVQEPIDMEVSKISLMKSERIQGILTYEEIYHVDL